MPKPSDNEDWIVGIDDKVELHKVRVLKHYAKCVEIQDLIDGLPKGPKKIILNRDIEFIERLKNV